MMLKSSLETLDTLEADALAIGLCSDSFKHSGLLAHLDWRLCGEISKLIRSGTLSAVNEETLLVSTKGRIRPDRVFLFGWGDSFSAQSMCQTNLSRMLSVLKRAGIHSCAIAVPEQNDDAQKAAAQLLRKDLPLRIVGIL